MTRDDKASVIAAITRAMKEIAYWHRQVRIEGEREHPQDAGWAQTYAELAAARDLLRGRAG